MELLEDESQWRLFLRNHGYILSHQIGYGSFGDVFSVTTTSLQNDVRTKYAVKRLVTRRNILDDECIMMEIHSLLRLKHQNIVCLHDVVLTKTVACIVMELAPLGNLDMFFKSPGLKTDREFVTTAFTQILSAIEYLHDVSLAHRDINPTNVLVYVCNSCLVKLADFGLCFQCKDSSNGQPIPCTDYLGHDNYLAPEVKKCEPFCATRADIWSLGCLLSYLVTSSRCFTPDQSNCTSAVHRDSESLCNVAGTENIVTSTVETNCDVDSVIQRCRQLSNVDGKRRDEKLFFCFIKTLCRHSSHERPTVKEASQSWSNIVTVIKDFDKASSNNSLHANRTHKEE